MLIGDLQAALLKQLALAGVHHEPQGLAGSYGVEALTVCLGVIGQHRAIGLVVAGQGQSHGPLVGGHGLNIAVGIVVGGGAGHLTGQFVHDDVVVGLGVGKGVRVGLGIDVRHVRFGRVGVDGFIFHKHSHVAGGLIEGEGFSVGVQRVEAGRAIGVLVFARVEAAPGDGLHRIALFGRHGHGVGGIIGRNLYVAILAGVLIHLYGVIGGGDLLDGRLQLSGGFRLGLPLLLSLDLILAGEDALDLQPAGHQGLIGLLVHIDRRIVGPVEGRRRAGVFIHRARGGEVVHLFTGGGLHVDVAVPGDDIPCALGVQLSPHVLEHHGNARIAAGNAPLIPGVRDGVDLHIAIGGGGHIVARLQRTVHGDPGIHGHIGGGEGQGHICAGIGAGGDAQIRIRGGADAVRRGDVRVGGDMYDGIHVRQREGHRQTVDGVAVLIEARGGLCASGDVDAAPAGVQRVIARVEGAVHVHGSAGDLEVHQIHLFQVADVDDAALLFHIGRHNDVAFTEYMGALADGHFGDIGDVQKLQRIGAAQVDVGQRYLAVVQSDKRVPVGAVRRFDAHQSGLQRAVHLHGTAVQHQLETVGGDGGVFVYNNGVAVVRRDDHIGHQQVGRAGEQYFLALVLGKPAIDIVGEGQGDEKRAVPADLHLALVLQIVRDGIHAGGRDVEGIVDAHKVNGAGVAAGIDVPVIIIVDGLQLACHMQAVAAVAALYGDGAGDVGDGEVHVGLVLAAAQVDVDGTPGIVAGGIALAALAGDENGVVARLGMDLDEGILRRGLGHVIRTADAGDADDIVARAGIELGLAVAGYMGVDGVVARAGGDDGLAAVAYRSSNRVAVIAGHDGQRAPVGGRRLYGIRARAGVDQRRAVLTGHGNRNVVLALAGLDDRGTAARDRRRDGVRAGARVDGRRAAVLRLNIHGVRALAGMQRSLRAFAGDGDVRAIVRTGAVVIQLRFRAVNGNCTRQSDARDLHRDAPDRHAAGEYRGAIGLHAVAAGVHGGHLQLKIVRDLTAAVVDRHFAIVGGVLLQHHADAPGQRIPGGLHGIVDLPLKHTDLFFFRAGRSQHHGSRISLRGKQGLTFQNLVLHGFAVFNRGRQRGGERQHSAGIAGFRAIARFGSFHIHGTGLSNKSFDLFHRRFNRRAVIRTHFSRFDFRFCGIGLSNKNFDLFDRRFNRRAVLRTRFSRFAFRFCGHWLSGRLCPGFHFACRIAIPERAPDDHGNRIVRGTVFLCFRNARIPRGTFIL